jgi:hypothetical protein
LLGWYCCPPGHHGWRQPGLFLVGRRVIRAWRDNIPEERSLATAQDFFSFTSRGSRSALSLPKVQRCYVSEVRKRDHYMRLSSSPCAPPIFLDGFAVLVGAICILYSRLEYL